MFITYDLDADAGVRATLNRLGLKEREDFLPLGIKQAGKDSIEGLLPQRVLATVNGRETDLVMKLGSRDSAERRDAKQRLKKMYLAEFKGKTDYPRDELGQLTRVLKTINGKFAAKQ